MHVLIVDDEQAFAAPLAERLSLRGLKAQAVTSAEQALASLADALPDIVFLDVHLAESDGISLLQSIRQHYPALDVIMLTGSTDMQTALRAMRYGAKNWLPKPISVDTLLEECVKAAQRQRQRAHEQHLAELDRLRSLGRIAEGVAHEVNNPLNIIMQAAGFIEDLLESPACRALPQHQAMAQAVSTMSRQSLRVRELTHSLLMVGLGLDPRTQPVDVPSVLHQTLALVAERAAQQQVIITEALAPALPRPLWANAELQQVARNLLENALDAMPQGGRLHIAASLCASPPTSMELEEEALPEHEPVHSYALTFTDTGCGIAPEQLPHIFEPFYTTRAHGQGLGLAVCRSLVQGCGGSIRAYSTLGKGCRMCLRLPLAPEAKPQKSPPSNAR
ncbi:MAG: response regulator [Desulfovibrionaceae bacterium]|nr:response regulator [Desulfovibrionaceae bacterium]